MPEDTPQEYEIPSSTDLYEVFDALSQNLAPAEHANHVRSDIRTALAQLVLCQIAMLRQMEEIGAFIKEVAWELERARAMRE